MRRQVAYLRCNGATVDTPILIIKRGNKWQYICGDDIMSAIRDVVRAAGPDIGFTKDDISILSLHSGGVMALLMAWLGPDAIILVGRWRSNTMLRCLHTTPKTFTEGISAENIDHITYALIPPVHSGN